MNDKRSVEELLASISELIFEAKEEYERILDIENKEQERISNIIHPKTLSSSKTLNTQVKQTIEHQLDSYKKDNRNDWININFKKNITDKNRINECSTYSNDVDSNILKKRFNELLNIWLDKNLEKLIEVEFTNTLKKR